MNYKEFTIHTTDEAEELVSDILWNYTDYGVAVSSLKDVLELTENRRNTFDYIDDAVLNQTKGIALVKGYFDIKDAPIKKSMIIKDFEVLKLNAYGNINVGSLEIVEREVNGDDWIEIWRKHFRPIEFNKITICPEWIKYEGKKDVVYIGSNTAFGTGEHETTSMCIEFLEKYIKKNYTVVDVGTGSGILGIAAAKLGAEKVILTDIDDNAINAAKHNAEANMVKDKCSFYNTNLVDGINIIGEIVVANITADVLLVLSDTISGYLSDGGVLILSGILNDKARLVKDTYKDIGFSLADEKSIGEWTALVFKK